MATITSVEICAHRTNFCAVAFYIAECHSSPPRKAAGSNPVSRTKKGLTQAELALQAGLGLRTIIAYEKGETYPQKRSTYQTLADILGVQADDLHNEETATSAAPLSRAQWENAKQRYEELLPDGPAWPGVPTYGDYCKQATQFANANAASNYYKSTGQELPQTTIRPALPQDFPALLQICKDRCQFDATRAGIDKSKRSQLPTFESQLETLTRSLVGWISAGQCFLMEANGHPGAWFVLQLPAPDDYLAPNKRKGGAKATASTPLPRATLRGPYTSPRFAGASKYMLTFCQACCPRLDIEVPLDDPLSRFRLAYWLDQGFVPDTLAPSGRTICLLLHGE
ncbi:MAG: helix-turn-helix transcriptional regulator [Gemmiger sp.]